jgi:hypothetical protein
MKRTVLIPTVCLVFILPLKVCGQEWRGLQPLKSNCEDVKRALGVDKCEYPETTYRLTGETVTIGFQSCPCPSVCYSEFEGWNVPRGTVLTILRQLHNPLPITDFDVNSGKWTTLQTDFIGEIIYTNRDGGIRISAIDGKAVTINYYPPVYKFKRLRCPNCFQPNTKTNDITSPVFIAYGENMSVDREKFRLDEFVLKLRKLGQTSKAYIVAYEGCTDLTGKARTRALRVQEYLVAQGIGRRRITVINGGQRESMLIEVHGRERNMPPPRSRPSIYPRNHPFHRRD